MIDHMSFAVSDLKRSRAFYDAALKPLGYTLANEFGVHLGYGKVGKPSFWIDGGGNAEEYIGKGRGFHIAFEAPDRPSVDAFHKAALAAGGRDNGQPGPRPHYHANYYGAFVIDPDGYRIEAVCHRPPR